MGVLLLAFIGALAQSAEAQAAFAISYSQLFSFVTWTAVGLLGAAATTAGQNLGAGHLDRAEPAVHVAARFGLIGAAALGLCFLLIPRQLLAVFGMTEPAVVEIGVQLLRVLSLSGSVRRGGAGLHGWPAGHRRHAKSDVHLDRVADRHSARLSASCCSRPARSIRSTSGSPYCSGMPRAVR